jgi:hypothetical protein
MCTAQHDHAGPRVASPPDTHGDEADHDLVAT